MVDLRAVFTAAGARQVSTYIQSGNVVFAHPSGPPERLRVELQQRIGAAAGFPVPVILRTAADLASVVRDNPFAELDSTRLLVAFLAEARATEALDSVDRTRFAPEEFALRGREVYLHLPAGAGRAKLPQTLDALLATWSTTRNWRTVTKLLELARGTTPANPRVT